VEKVMTKRFLFLLLSLLTALAPGQGVCAKAAQPMAVLIAADWCGNCKVIKPKLKQAYKNFEGQMSFVSLDVTDDARFAQSQKLAVKLGVPQLLAGQVATGWVALIDRSGKQIGELRQTMSVEEMQQALQALVGEAN
jgi:thiol-disulfide isomerase/thioredoxin